jgi:hypothetical protein
MGLVGEQGQLRPVFFDDGGDRFGEHLAFVFFFVDGRLLPRERYADRGLSKNYGHFHGLEH